MQYAEERRAVVATCRELSARRLVVGTAGNVSVRVGDHVVISPSAVAYDEMTAGAVAVCDLSGRLLEAPLAPSSELPLHLSIYRSSGHTAVIHTHAIASTALSTVVDVVPPTHYYTAMFGGPVRVAGYATYGTAQLAQNVVAALQDRTAALMANHGAVLVGDDLASVLARVEYLEYLCEVVLRAGAYGLPARELDEAELARVAELIAGYRPAAGLAGPDQGL